MCDEKDFNFNPRLHIFSMGNHCQFGAWGDQAEQTMSQRNKTPSSQGTEQRVSKSQDSILGGENVVIMEKAEFGGAKYCVAM